MSKTESDLELDMPKIDGDSQMTNTNYSNVQMVQNRLGYRMPQKKSLVSKRRHVNNDFDKSVYTSNDSQMQCKINSSTDFICNANCYLSFNMKVVQDNGLPPGDAYYLDPSIGACSIFNELQIEDKGGTESGNIKQLSDEIRNRLYTDCPLDYLRSVGQVGGIYLDNLGNYIAPGADGPQDLSNEQSFVIPLWWIHGFFDKNNDLIPPQLSSGLRLRFNLNTPLKALYKVGATAETVIYQISQPKIVNDNMTLSPLVARKIMEISGNQGLIYSFCNVFEQGDQASATQLNLEINKSVGVAKRLMWIYQDQQNTPPATGNVGIVARGGTGAIKTTEQQVRLGDLYWPQSVIKVTATQPAELYYNTTYSTGHAGNCNVPFALSYNNFKKSPTLNSDDGFNINVQTMESQEMLEDGLPVNNARSLVINNTFATATLNREIKAYLYYLQILNVFPRNVVPSS